MTMDTLVKRKEISDGRVGAPPALPPSPPPPLPPPRPVAKPGRRLQSSSNGNFVNELSITGPNAVVSWNSHTPELTSFNCTGVGDGRLICSGDLHATDFTTTSGNSLDTIKLELDAVKNFVRMLPPSVPPSTPPPSPPMPPLPPGAVTSVVPCDCTCLSSWTTHSNSGGLTYPGTCANTGLWDGYTTPWCYVNTPCSGSTSAGHSTSLHWKECSCLV